MADVEVFGDIACPFTHVALRYLFDARQRRHAEGFVHVSAWPLEWVNGEPLAPSLVAHEIEALRAQVAPDAFARFSPSTFPRTSMPAFGLVAAGYAAGPAVGEALSAAVRDALFERGLDVTDPDVLRSLGADHGVVPFDLPTTEAAVRRDWERGIARGVKGSPHFFTRDRDWFCPTLRIEKHGADFDISFDLPTMHEFVESAVA
jgi:predicted DsbA family dithiol-disulfide isomerase